MVDTFVNCTLRNDIGSNACNRIRNAGHIPGVIYGHNFQNYPLDFDLKHLKSVIRDHGENAVVNVEINGSTYPAMIKEVQRNPVTGNIMHIDLQQLVLTEKIHTAVPILFSGKGMLNNGTILQQQIQKVDIECYPDAVPKNITVDVSNLSIGDVLKVSDVEFGEEISILNDVNEIVASLTYAKEEKVEEETEEEENLYVQEFDSPNIIVNNNIENENIDNK